MAEVMASCEKCGAFLPACIHVMANGLVSVDGQPQAAHWEASPDCRGSYGLMHVSHLQQAAAMAKSVRDMKPWRPSLRERFRFFRARVLVALHLRRLRREPDIDDEG